MSLSSLLVERGVATIADVEEALGRQVLYGGDLVTNLFEVTSIDERDVVRVMAEAVGLDACEPGALPSTTERALGKLPRDVAERLNVYPIDLDRDGEQLVLAVAEPLSETDEDNVMFSIGLAIDQRVAPLARVRQALARDLGFPLDRRTRRIVDTLDDRLAGKKVPVPDGSAPDLKGDESPFRPSPSAGMAAVRVVEPEEPRRPISVPPPSRPSVPIMALSPVRRAMRTPAFASPVPTTFFRDSFLPPPRPRRRRGPITLDRAIVELDRADGRDALLDLFFDFARQYFEYAAFFSVQGDLAEGRDAFGDGASRERVVGVGVPLDLPGVLAEARDSHEVVVRDAEQKGIDAVLLRDLERASVRRVAIVPLSVGRRVVALLYGDGGDIEVERDTIEEVVQFADLVSKAFERLIVRRKRFEHKDAGAEPADVRWLAALGDAKRRGERRKRRLPDAVSRAEALSRALVSESGSKRPSLAPPEPDAEPVDDDVAVPSTPRSGVPRARAGFGPTVSEPESHEGGAPDDVHTASDATLTRVAVRRPSVIPIPREDSEGDAAHAESVSVDRAGVLAANIASGGSSRSDSRGPHAPPASRPPRVLEKLPKIMVDVASELEPLVDALIENPSDESVEAELLRQGRDSMPAIIHRFPGPARPDLTLASSDEPERASDCGPLLRLVARQRRAAVPFVVPLIDAEEEPVRFFATWLVVELPYREAVPAIVSRLSDSSRRVRRAAERAVHALARTVGGDVAHALGSVVAKPTASAELRTQYIDLLGEARVAEAVPYLVDVVRGRSPQVREAAHRALQVLAAQDFGRDEGAWRVWWANNRDKHRIEWLIAALDHELQPVRERAGEELKGLTREYFGYYADLPPEERREAQARYESWWRQEGRLRFMPPA